MELIRLKSADLSRGVMDDLWLHYLIWMFVIEWSTRVLYWSTFYFNLTTSTAQKLQTHTNCSKRNLKLKVLVFSRIWIWNVARELSIHPHPIWLKQRALWRRGHALHISDVEGCLMCTVHYAVVTKTRWVGSHKGFNLAETRRRCGKTIVTMICRCKSVRWV